MSRHGDPLHRYEVNPILSAAKWPDCVAATFNPGAVSHDGETILLVRVEDKTGRSRLDLARSADGLTHWTIEPERGLSPELDSFSEHAGIEDARITKFADRYLITYTGYSSGGPLICIAETRDFHSYVRHGVALPPENKDAALFPVTFDGRYALVHRPVPHMGGCPPGIWLSFSPDLQHWGGHVPLLDVRGKGWWDSEKIGIGPPPLQTSAGWLILYHGVRSGAGGAVYRAGLALLDLDDPRKPLARSADAVLAPRADYERYGDVGNVVFPTGWTLAPNGDTLHIYYGAADTTVCVAHASLAQLLDSLTPIA